MGEGGLRGLQLSLEISKHFFKPRPDVNIEEIPTYIYPWETVIVRQTERKAERVPIKLDNSVGSYHG